MERKLVYDLPTRLFHWFFAILFLSAFIIAKNVDDESSLFNYHSLAGLTLGFLVLLRIVWGFTGTKYARFSSFALNPKDLIAYFKGILSGEKKRWAGHNPASSWAGIIMMTLGVCLGITGYLMTSGPYKETFEDVHEIFAKAFLIVVILHVAGIALHTFRFREMIGLSMLNGKKDKVTSEEAIPSAKSAFGILLVALVLAFGLNLYKNYDSNTRALQFFGTTLQLSDLDKTEAGHDNSAIGTDREDHEDHD